MLGPFLWQSLGVNESMGAVSGKAELCALFGCGKSRKMSDAAPIGTPIGAGEAHQRSRLAAQLARQSCAGLRQLPCGRVPLIDHDDACRPFFPPSSPPATGVCLGVDCPDRPRRQLPLLPSGGQPKGAGPPLTSRAVGNGLRHAGAGSMFVDEQPPSD